jgi:tRNA (guanosine-2'-O-)-methyltransferase
MRHISASNLDVFRPMGQLERELRLAQQHPKEVVEALRPWLSETRQSRIEQVLTHRTRTLAVAVEGVRDPHNVAAVIRSADAMGVQAVHIIENGRPFRSSRKVTQGAHRWLDIGVWEDPKSFAHLVRGQGKRIYYAAADASLSVEDICTHEPAVLVFGNEHEGISPAMRDLADGGFCVPMYGFVDSFNISVAASLALYALRHAGRGDLSDDERKILRARFYLTAVNKGYEIVERCAPHLLMDQSSNICCG